MSECKHFDLLTIFPELFDSPLQASLLGKAIQKKLIEVRVCDVRRFATDRHRTVDDIPYGGGAGMVMKVEPIVAALEATSQQGQFAQGKKVRRIYLSPQGRRLEQGFLSEYLQYDQLILLCGRYEGVDARVEHWIDEELSIGDYVLMGGEFAALVFLEALVRLIPGVVGKEESVRHDSFSDGLLEYPQYTRPEEFRGLKVPEVLLSGHHGKIEQWRREAAHLQTEKKRSDLIKTPKK